MKNNLKYSFPYSLHPACNLCEKLNVDYEEDKIKRYCDNKECQVYKDYYNG